MDRREALRRTALLMGGVVSAPAILGVLQGCKAKPGMAWKPEFLNENQASIVSQVAEIIIPRTDTPGAKDAGVPAFIDKMLKECYTAEDQKRFTEGLQAFNDDAKKAYGEDFWELDEEDQAAFVTKVHDAAVQESKDVDSGNRPFILMMKELTMLGFFTSEPGATQVLQYVAVPGAYHGCISVSEAGNGKTWAT
jgi:hypothetical protein